MVTIDSHVQVPIAVYGNVVWHIEANSDGVFAGIGGAPRSVACSGVYRSKGDFPNPSVSGVRDMDVSDRVESQTLRYKEIRSASWPAITGKSPNARAGHRRDNSGSAINPANAVVASIQDVHVTCGIG